MSRKFASTAIAALTLAALLVSSQISFADSTEGTYTIGTTPGVSVVCSPDCLGEPGLNIGGYTFEAEGTVPISLRIADTSGGPVSFTVCQDFDGRLCGDQSSTATAGPEPRVVGCGTTADLSTSTVAFKDNKPTSIFIRLVDPQTCAGTALGGTLTLTFA